MSQYQPLTLQRTTHPVTTYFTCQLTLKDPNRLKWDNISLVQLVTAALTKLYGFIGSVAVKFDIITFNATAQTITFGVEDYASNALRAALVYYNVHNETHISINTIGQGSTLDHCTMVQQTGEWYTDLCAD